ncbi:MAG: tetratricopeptide repeat protein [Gallionella sp.]|nr:tetratricopeptide repeat protein [Gallionella sp.]
MKSLVLTILALLLVGNAQAVDNMQYGRAYLAEGDNAAAVRSYSQAVDLNPFDPVAHNNLAVAKAAQGDYQAAMDLLQRAVKLAPKRTDIRDNMNRLRDWMRQDNGVRNSAQVSPIWHKPTREFAELPPLWGSAAAARVAIEIRPKLRMIKQLHYVPGVYP